MRYSNPGDAISTTNTQLSMCPKNVAMIVCHQLRPSARILEP